MSIIEAETTTSLFDGIEAPMTVDVINSRSDRRAKRVAPLIARASRYEAMTLPDNMFDHLSSASLDAIIAMNEVELKRLEQRVSRTMAVASHALGVALYVGEVDTLAHFRVGPKLVEVKLNTPFMDIDEPAIVGQRLDVLSGFSGMAMVDTTLGPMSPKHTSILDAGMAILIAETDKKTS